MTPHPRIAEIEARLAAAACGRCKVVFRLGFSSWKVEIDGRVIADVGLPDHAFKGDDAESIANLFAEAPSDLRLLLAERKKLREVVTEAIPYVKHDCDAIELPIGHACGPEGGCDCDCVAKAYGEKLLVKMRAALAAPQEVPEDEK